MQMKRKTIYNIIRNVESGKSLKQNPGQGRPAVKMTIKKVKELVKRVNGRAGISQQKLAQKYKISHQWVSAVLKRNGIQYYKRTPKPKTTEAQKKKQKKCLIKISKNEFRPTNDMKIVMDDESYFPLTGHNIPGNDGYYASDKSSVATEVKYRSKEKYPPKVMVWIAISECGSSVPYFNIRRGTMDSSTYAKECITKRLVPFLRKHHNDGQYHFWPDGATAHYGKQSIDAYNMNDIKYVKRQENPPNVPQLRPIELFWAHLKSRVYAKDWKALNLSHLESRIRRKIKEFDPSYFSNLTSKVKPNVRKAADLGPEFMFK